MTVGEVILHRRPKRSAIRQAHARSHSQLGLGRGSACWWVPVTTTCTCGWFTVWGLTGGANLLGYTGLPPLNHLMTVPR